MVKGPRESIALAADLPLDEGLALARRIRAQVGVVKVGLSLFVEHGPAAVAAFRAEGFQVFLDLKLHDIPRTVELAAGHAAALGVSYLTVHASGAPAMLKAAVAGAAEGAARAGVRPPVVLAVTVLTSMDAAALAEVGVPRPPHAQVLSLAAMSVVAGVGGLVCAVEEVSALRRAYPPPFELVTPGIRPAGVGADDQLRVDTPAAAIFKGSTLLVVGRAITAAPDPEFAAGRIFAEVTGALAR